MKTVLSKELHKGRDIGLNQAEVDVLRWHGAKATMTSLMQHLNLSPKAVRLSGGWADKHESMADVYLREAQLMTLRSQERCLLYLRKGGDLGGLVGEPIAKDPLSRESPAGAEEAATAAGPSPPKSWSDEEVERALGNFAMGPAELAEEFLDEVLSRPVPDYTMVEAEKSIALDQEDVQSLLVDYDSPSEEATATLSLPDDGEDAEGKRSTVPESEEAAQEQADEIDTEGMVAHFVQLEKPVQSSRVHMAAAARDDEAGVQAHPRCGAKGSFAYLGSSEAFVSPFCVRCFGQPRACVRLCDAKIAIGADVYLRCTRRCSCDRSADKHRCHIHK